MRSRIRDEILFIIRITPTIQPSTEMREDDTEIATFPFGVEQCPSRYRHKPILNATMPATS